MSKNKLSELNVQREFVYTTQFDGDYANEVLSSLRYLGIEKLYIRDVVDRVVDGTDQKCDTSICRTDTSIVGLSIDNSTNKSYTVKQLGRSHYLSMHRGFVLEHRDFDVAKIAVYAENDQFYIEYHFNNQQIDDQTWVWQCMDTYEIYLSICAFLNMVTWDTYNDHLGEGTDMSTFTELDTKFTIDGYKYHCHFDFSKNDDGIYCVQCKIRPIEDE